MKNTLTLIVLLFVSISFGQDSYNKWSIDADFGMNKTWTNRGLATKLSISSNLGVRYMLNNNFGLKLDLGYNRFQNNDKFNKTNLYSLTGYAVANIGHMLRFETFAKRLGLLAYVGAGSSFFSIDKFDVKDKMLLGSVGFTIQYKVIPRLAVNLNLVNTVNIMQNRNFDGSVSKTRRSLDGMYTHLGLGVSYYFGKEKEHADWIPTVYGGRSDNSKYDAYEAKIASLEEQLKDDDKDGVPNFRDDELDSAPEALVNSKGVTLLDTDGDGIADKFDLCPNKSGIFSDNGCPDTDGDGVDDLQDKCPKIAGVRSNNGCPEIDKEVERIMAAALKGVQFETGKSVLLSRSSKVLDNVFNVMKDEPTYYLNVWGYTDSQGDDEANLTLSKERAAAVTTYLVDKGIEVSRLHSQGFGEENPKASNETDAGRAINRRVEFKVVFE